MERMPASAADLQELDRDIRKALHADLSGPARNLMVLREVSGTETLEGLIGAIRGNVDKLGNLTFECPSKLRWKLGLPGRGPVTVNVERDIVDHMVLRLEYFIEARRQALRRKMARVLGREGDGGRAA